jgi:hypothetical protein
MYFGFVLSNNQCNPLSCGSKGRRVKAVGAVVIRHLGPVKSPRADIVGLREGTDPLSTVG